MEKLLNKLPARSRKTVISIVGGVVLVVGVIMIPYPGPGWLVVFMGLAILAQEFPWAEKVLKFAKSKYDAWNTWIKQQPMWVQSLTFIATCAVVIVTIWLVNGYGLLNSWLHLQQPWLQSPFMR